MSKRKLIFLITNHLIALCFALIMVGIQFFHNYFVDQKQIARTKIAPINLVMPPFTGFKIPIEGESVLNRRFWVKKGEKLTESKVESLTLLTKNDHSQVELITFLFIYYIISLFFFYYIDRRKKLDLKHQIGYLAFTIPIAIFAKFTANFSDLSIFVLPLSGLLGIYLIFFEKRVAVALMGLQSFVISAIYLFNPFILLSFMIGGGIATLFYNKTEERIRFIYPFIVGTVITALLMLVFNLSAHRPPGDDLRAILWSFLGLPVLYIVIQLLRLYSPFFKKYDLIPYINRDHPLLKKLEAQAPGTYQHSLAMATLAETAANAINVNGLLCRAGAYYHDIGKMIHPEYFIENQNGGENPHNFLEPEESARMIKLHVSDGLKMAQEYGLPDYLIEFIDKHHGTTLLEYFYQKAIAADKDVGIDDFRYPGRKPDTKETAILMLVDAVEAASRTIDEPTVEKIEALVTKIIFSKLLHNQLNNATLTLGDLRKITVSLIESLRNNAHTRVKYPWQKNQEKA